ncbi:lycopene cyclase domain-containing protein [Arthrobacter sp. zg-ZUI100]|uniref:lycopene cyclase domain-containing protein n=1 Tax=Arthrobacter jiangjiafuii TaxID=2817475 RepID=UPI001AED64FC|nr:lycopene cyclase domain-containing protein [Arthrobacter jiangjiafuii]
MTYWALNAVFLVPAAAVLALALLRHRAKGAPAALAVTAVVLLVLTAVFDNVMIAAGLFSYNPDRISGAFIGSAPLEDFAYALAAVLLLPALWMLLGKPAGTGRAEQPDPARHDHHPAEPEEKP